MPAQPDTKQQAAASTGEWYTQAVAGLLSNIYNISGKWRLFSQFVGHKSSIMFHFNFCTMSLPNNFFRWLLSIFFVSLMFACNQEENLLPQDSSQQQLDNNLLKGGAAYRKAVDGRNTGDGTEFNIKDVKREGNLLKVYVEGGCNEASFQFIWNGEIAESYPMQISLVLIHEQVSEICPAVIDHTPQLDLTKLLGEQAQLKDYVFHIYNGSKKQDSSLDPNGTTSIKTNE